MIIRNLSDVFFLPRGGEDGGDEGQSSSGLRMQS